MRKTLKRFCFSAAALLLCALTAFSGSASDAPEASSDGFSISSDYDFSRDFFKQNAGGVANTLYVIDGRAISSDELVLAQTLQGIVAKTKAQIYIIASDAYEFWLNDLRDNWNINYEMVPSNDVFKLCEQFKSYVKDAGYVKYDPSTPSKNAASTIAGQKNYLAVASSLTGRAETAGFTMKIDATGFTADDSLLNDCSSALNTSMVLFQRYDNDGLRDFGVAQNALYAFPDTTDRYGAYLDFLDENGVVLGWHTDEGDGVTKASRGAGVTMASDHSYNLSVFENLPRKVFTQKTTNTAAKNGKVHYVTFIMSDGDNVQWHENGAAVSAKNYGSARRGEIPFGWTMAPALADLAPNIMRYEYENATPNDHFVTAVSGFGYIYPSSYPQSALQAFAERTDYYMEKSGSRYMELLDNAKSPSAELLSAFTSQPHIDGIFYETGDWYLGASGKLWWSDGKPVVGVRESLWTVDTSDAQKLESAPADMAKRISYYDKNPSSINGYTAVNVHVWSHSYEDCLEMAKWWEDNDSGVVIVTPDRFMELIAENVPQKDGTAFVNPLNFLAPVMKFFNEFFDRIVSILTALHIIDNSPAQVPAASLYEGEGMVPVYTGTDLESASKVGKNNPEWTPTDDPYLLNARTPALITTRYTTADAVVADYIATQYKADPTGVSDSTAAIQNAVDDCYNGGGGTVFLPAGRYKITCPIQVKPFVTLRGDWQDPDRGSDYGTILLADVPSSDDSSTGLFVLGGSAGVCGLTVFYPHQTLENVLPYPYTFYIPGDSAGAAYYMLQSVTNCTVINGYRGVGACVAGGVHEMLTVENLKGTFLCQGAAAFNQADVGTWKNVTFNNRYWSNAWSGFARPSRLELDAYTKKNGVGLLLGDLEWTQFAGISVSDYSIGIHIVDGKRIKFAGSFYAACAEDCVVGLQADTLDERWGLVAANSVFEGSKYAVVNGSDGCVKMSGVTLTGGTKGARIKNYPVTYGNTKTNFAKTANEQPSRLFCPVLDGTGQTDVSLALQNALTDAGQSGGGIIYLPAGQYRLGSPVTVPENVELRGAASVPVRGQNGSKGGTALFAYCGENAADPDGGTALITLSGANAGVRGLMIIYPENGPVDMAVKPYNYAVRGVADGVYAVNICIGAGYNGIDFRGCDDYLIKALVTCCYNNAIQTGGGSGMIEGCLQNGTVITRNGYNLGGLFSNEADIFTQLFNPITRVDSTFIKVSGGGGQTVLNCFAYGVKTLIESDGGTVNAFNIGADNLGGPMLKTRGGRVTVINMLRWNGSSYENNGTDLTILNRLTIDDEREKNVK